jgi:hypothetical protein
MLSHLGGSAASHLVEGGGAHVLPPRFLRAPLLRDGLHIVPAAGGLCSLAWQEGMGYHLSCVRLRGLRPPTTFMLTAAGLWQQSVLQRGGAVNRCWCDGGGGHPPSSGGGLRRINAFRRLPCPLWWVPVGEPSECYPVASYCVRRPRWGGLDFFTARKGDVVLEYSWASACVCPPEGGPEVLVVHNGHCVA